MMDSATGISVLATVSMWMAIVALTFCMGIDREVEKL
jgi:hypothetical protein